MKIKVIDISYAQSKVDFNKLKAAGVSAVMIRTGYYGKTDTMFHSHISGAIEAGLDIGVYTYIMADNAAQAALEAEETVKRLEKYKGYINYPVFCDMESSKYYSEKYSKASRTDMIEAFCNTIRGAGYYPAVYINPSWLNQWTEKERIIGKYDIWLASWTYSADTPTKYDFGQTMWQWGTERIDGVKGLVDSDICYVDYPKIIREAGKNFLSRKYLVTAEKEAEASELEELEKRLKDMGFSVNIAAL